ncbi:hypothetical protein EPD60_07340 [Flaviaesturariibacter flavus]|uniref:T9SS type A sorting domain-containing protein n=1 Tax=Flaviaesturariibacter flavus TaxID=2502780 RepID=A0A4R1BH48_9BACT|nr:immunoglobulin domain-containing protein [Flaviaesturariibacter flavus]TCJ16550.1 hypothetical protein EPD60_07340 [Flaviaesturariibacter flavus]
MRKLYSLFALLFIAGTTLAQSTANYSVSSTTNGSLALDLNGNAIDMSTGTNLIAAASSDQPTATVNNIGFDFYFMGVPYSQFSATANGIIRLGSTAIATSQYTIGSASMALIAPFGGDEETSSTGKVHYKVVGTAPNRVLVVEFLNMGLDYTGSYQNPDGTFQARLYESTGKIEYVYGNMNVNSSGANTGVFSIGFSSGSAANTIMSITNTSTNAFSTTAVTLITPTRPTGTTAPYPTSPIPDLNSASDGSRKTYVFTPPVPAAPTALNFTAVTVSSMTLNWTDAAGELGYVIQRSSDGINYTNIASLAANTTTYAATGLAANTNYFWKVVSFSEGTFNNALSGSQATPAGTLSGIKTVGTGGDYTNLTTAFAAINANGLAGNITLQLIAGYPAAPETYPIVSSNSVVGNFTVTVYPTVSGLQITSSNATGTLNLNNGTNIIFDGRVNATGGAPDLVISNTATGGYGIQMINDATGNIFRFLVIQGVTTSTTSGVIAFQGTTGTLGNSNNTITSCFIRDGATTPTNAIYSSSSAAAAPNANNVVSNNSIINFFAAGSSSNGILVSSNGTGWTISGNSFYQTATRTSTSGNTHAAITISNTGGGYVINNNVIGGGNNTAGGTPWTLAGAFGNKLIGISISAGTTPVSSIQGNTVANFSLASTSSATTAGGVFSGIYIGSGSVNVGTTTANTIGSGTGTGSITVTTSSNSGGAIYGIYSVSSNVVTINNNVIGSFNITNPASSAIYESFYGIRVTSGTNTVTGNSIGSSTTALSINNAAGNTSTTSHATRGISSESGTSSVISNNNIYNIAYTAGGTGAQVQGINITSGTNTVSGNVIYALSSTGPNAGTGTAVSIMGIYYGASTAPATVSQNTIYDLSNSAATAAVTVRGMYYGGPASGTNLVSRNFIHSLSTASNSTTAMIEGIYIASGIGTFQNNMVRLGIDKAGAALTNAGYVGIDKPGTGNVNIYHNSIYIGGAGAAVSANSVAFRRTATGTDDVRNNIFANVRSNAAGTGKHYAIGINATTTLTSNYNILFVSGTGGFIGYNGAPGATDYVDLGTWTAATGLDVNSVSSNPKFVAPEGTSTTVDLHVQMGTPAEAAGVNIAAVTDDFDGQTRSTLTPTDIGADAGDFTIPGADVGITGVTTPAATGCYSATETITVTLKNFGSNPINFATDNVTVNVNIAGPTPFSGSRVLNTGTLAAGASMAVTMPTTASLTAQGTYTITANAVIAGDVNASNNAMSPAIRTSLVLGGTKTVGVGGDYATLTAAIAAYNSASCFSGPVVFSLIDATYPGEAFPIVINQNTFAGANSLTIKPAAGNNATISGSSSSALIKINGADRVIIDGSNNGSASRNLTLVNTNTGTSSALIWIASATATDAATQNTVKNLVLTGNASTTTLMGVFMGGTGSISTSTSALAANSGNTIQNNVISKTQYGIFLLGTSVTTLDDGNAVIDNQVGVTGAGNELFIGGIDIRRQTNAIVRNNIVENIKGASGTNMQGINLQDVTNSVVSENIVRDMNYSGSSTTKVYGITTSTSTFNTAANASANQYINNMVYGLTSAGTSASWNTSGINNNGGYGDKYYFNTVYLSGQLSGSGGTAGSAAFSNGNGITSTSADAIEVVNNIFYVNATSVAAAPLYAHYTTRANYTGSVINYNDLVSIATGPATAHIGYIGANRTTLALWRTNTAQEANSVSIQPFFTNNALHLDPANSYALDNLGTSIPAVNNDIDGDARAANPDMGADEFDAVTCSGAVGGNATAATTTFCNSGSATITATGYSEGAVSSYQWESSADGNTWTPVAGQTNPATLSTGTLTATTYYRLKVTCNTGQATDYSNEVLITINPNPNVTVAASQATICPAGSTTLTASGNASTYAWSPATGLSATTGASVTATPAASTTYTVTGTITATGCTASATVVVAVSSLPSAVTVTPASATICPTGPAVQLTLSGGLQTATATTGTNATTTSTAGITPFNSNWEGSRTQYLVRASELNAQGLTAGDISELSFKVTAAGTGTFTQKNFSMKIAHTAQSALTSAYGTPVGSFTTVYTNASEPAPAVGVKTFTFITPFSWDGASNILIDICHDNDPTATCASCFSSSSTVAATTTSFNSVWGSYADNAPSCGVQASNTITTVNLRPDMTFKVVSAATYSWSPATGLYTDAAATTPYSSGNVTTVYALPATTTVYTATATNSAGCTASGTATITVNQAPAITAQPQATAVCAGGNATFHVTATGTGVTYQWRKDGADITGATTDTYSITGVSAAAAAQYSVVVSGTCTPAVTSANAQLTVNTAPVIGTQPVSQTTCAGSPTTFVVAASGSALTYQWRKNGANITGATSASYTISNTASADAGSYDVVISGACAPAVTSAAATLTVAVAAAITTQPASQAICSGATASFTVVATNATGYQWRKDGVDIPGATAATYSIAAATAGDAGTYSVVITSNAPCTVVVSSGATLSFNAVTAITTQPAAATVCAGTAASFTVAATGTGLSYQWKKDGTNVPGATAATYTIASTGGADAGAYTVVVTGACGTLTSAAAQLTVNAATAISTQPAAQTVCTGAGATFSVSASGTALSYQWKKNGTDISGATAATYSIASASAADAATYSVVVTGTCGTITSANAALTVNAATSITTQPVASQAVCAGSNATLTVVATGAGLSYQWKKDGNNITGATSASYSIAAASAGDAGTYTVVVTGACGSVTSANAVLTLNATTSITTQPVAVSTCNGTSASFTVAAAGSGTLTYQWRKDGSNITGANSATYTINAVTAADAGSYSVVVTGACGNVTSAAAALTVTTCTAVSTLDPTVSAVSLRPSLAHDYTTIVVRATRASRLEWQLVDAKGTIVKVLHQNVVPGENQLRVTLAGQAAGSYFLNGISEKGKVATLRLVKL